MRARAFTPPQRRYLQYHRRQVFEKISGARRSLNDIGSEQDAAD